MNHHEETTRLRKLVYALLFTVVVGAALGRIFAAERVNEPSLHKPDKTDPRPLSVWPNELPPASPLFGSNDRSRWATLRALVDHGTYAIGERAYSAEGKILYGANGKPLDRSIWREAGWEPGYETVDRVLDPETHQFYSSKPPLLSTVLAGLYWLLQQLSGWTLAANLWEVVRTMLVLVNVLPFLLYLVLLSRLVERFAQTDWAKLFVMTAACFATLVTPFLVTLNNHTIATYCVLFALYPALLVWCGPYQPEAFARKDGSAGAAPFPAEAFPWYLFVAAGLFSSFAATCELPAAAFAVGLGLVLLLRAPRQTLLFFVPAALLPVAGFFVTNWLAIGQWRPAYSEFGSPWYLYEGSHWQNPGNAKRGIDFAANYETRGAYAFHVLLGHHGLFSLTPIWLLAFAGMVRYFWLAARREPRHSDLSTAQPLPWWFLPASCLLSLVVIGFYLFKSDNYGGWTAGLRWLMWLTPLWLLCMIPVLDKLSCCRWGRGLGYVLLAASVLSASYPAWNPWRHPWLYRFLDAQGGIPY